MKMHEISGRLHAVRQAWTETIEDLRLANIALYEERETVKHLRALCRDAAQWIMVGAMMLPDDPRTEGSTIRQRLIDAGKEE